MPEWQTIILTALVTTIGTIVVTFFHRWTVRGDTEREHERNATYLAIRVTTVLDPFVMSCVDVVNDSGAHDQEGELTPEVQEPQLGLPVDVNWKSIDPHLMDRILSLPNQIISAEKTLAFVGGMISSPPDHDEWFDERRRQWARIGLDALDIATELRSRYKLRPRDYSTYDPRPYLKAAAWPDDENLRKTAASAKKLGAKAMKKASGS